FGSLVAFYLGSLGWSQQSVGLVLTADGLAAVIGQAPSGALADTVRWKRGLAAAGMVGIAVAALVLAFAPAAPLVYAAAMGHGPASGVVPAAIAAITLGLVGRSTISLRAGRNYQFSAAGNALTAGAMAARGRLVAPWSMFLAAAGLCIPALAALFAIRPKEIDYARARNAGTGEAATKFSRVIDLRKNRELLVFTLALVLFQLADAAMLPAIGANLGHSQGQSRIVLMSA